MKRLWAGLAAMTMLAASSSVSAASRTMKVGEPAPDAELTLVDGSTVRLADLEGQVVLLNFWATWCVPCRQELPLLDAYYRKAQPHGLRAFAVTTEGSVPIYRLKSLFAAMAIPSVKRMKGLSGEMPAVPTNYIIDRAGIVRYAKAGAMDLDDLNRELVPLLKER